MHLTYKLTILTGRDLDPHILSTDTIAATEIVFSKCQTHVGKLFKRDLSYISLNKEYFEWEN